MSRLACATNRFRKALASGMMSSRRSRKRRQVDGNGADAVEQIFAQLAVLDGFVRLAIGGGDEAAVGLVAGLAADRADFLVLQHAQQFALRVDRHFGDFVQQQRAAFGLAEQTFAVGVRAGEGAFDGAEQFAFDQFARQGGAIDLDDLALAARAQGVDQVGDHFLARAAFAGDEHRTRRWARCARRCGRPLHDEALEDGRDAAAHGVEGASQRAVLFVLLLVLQRAFDVDQQALRHRSGLFEEMIGAPLGGLDGSFEAWRRRSAR